MDRRAPPGQDAHRPADGGGRVRRRRARHRPRLPRPLRAARGAAPGVRRLARRQQGQQRPARPRARSGWRPRAAARASAELSAAAAAGHRVLELQPLPGRGGLRQGTRLPQRPRQRPALGHRPGVRRGLHRRRAHLRAGPGRSSAAAAPPSLVGGAAARGSPTSSKALAFVDPGGLALVVPALVIPAVHADLRRRLPRAGPRHVGACRCSAMVATALVVGFLTWLQQPYLLRLQTKLSRRPPRAASSGTCCACRCSSSRSATPARSAAASPSTTWSPTLLSGQLATTVINLCMLVFYLADDGPTRSR